MVISSRSLVRRLAAAALGASICLGCPGLAAQPAGRGSGDPSCGPVFDGGGSVVVGQGGHSVKSASKRKCPGVSTSRLAPGTPKVRAPVIMVGAQEPAEGEEQLAVLDTDVGRVSAALVTGGALFWLLQSSIWTSLLILGIPLWRHVDLLPIVDRATDPAPASVAPKRDASEEQAVAAMLDTQRRRRRGKRTAP
jgi:hypothetical protein